MCGRFALRLDRPRIRHALPNAADWEDEELFVPRYNIAPRTYVPVIRRVRRAQQTDRDRDVLHSMKWGLVPHWSKVEDKSLSTTNARSENLVEPGGFWAAVKGKNRCAVVCQGYYEWLTKGKDKLPHFIKPKDDQLMLMAGLYDHAIIDGKSLWTFSIVTTDACPSFGWLHDRQPVILFTEDALNKWLDPSTQSWTSELTRLVQPYDDKQYHLDCYQVPKEVGKVGNESPSFIEPVKERKDGIQAMFQKQIQGASKRKRTQSPPPKQEQEQEHTPKKVKHETTPPKQEQEQEQTPKKVKHTTTPSSPRKQTPKKSSPRKVAVVPDKGKITSFFRKT